MTDIITQATEAALKAYYKGLSDGLGMICRGMSRGLSAEDSLEIAEKTVAKTMEEPNDRNR